MRRPRLQFFFFALSIFIFAAKTGAEAAAAKSYSFEMVDVDGNKLATADGHITTIVLAPSTGGEGARTVGDHAPDFCLGNPQYRMITILRFAKRHLAPTRAIMKAMVRRRLNQESVRLQERYRSKKIDRVARRDVRCVTDFDGAVVSKLGVSPSSTEFQVFVLGRTGELLGRWTSVPSREELAKVLK